jgi:hypothetical protein
VLGGVVVSEEASPKVVEERLARRESSELELRFDLMVDCEILRRLERKDGIVKVVRADNALCLRKRGLLWE